MDGDGLSHSAPKEGKGIPGVRGQDVAVLRENPEVRTEGAVTGVKVMILNGFGIGRAFDDLDMN